MKVVRIWNVMKVSGLINDGILIFGGTNPLNIAKNKTYNFI